MLTDSELKSLCSLGNDAEKAVQEILRLRRDLASAESLAAKAEAYAGERRADVVAAERERCAKLCEEMFSFGALEIADAMRRA